MEIRTRHMALFLYSGITALTVFIKPDLITTLTDLMIMTAPIAAMFAVDKVQDLRNKKK